MPGLSTYEAKRDFARTREPRGKRAKARGNSFVVQKHAARRLHYDLRLELDGVLKSWAVTKGPSLVPGEKRLAVEVEDHPLDYAGFEGTISKGGYGGGTVLVWDRGTWTPLGDPQAGLAKGHLDFRLDGERLHGTWHLVRMRHKPGEKRNNWLLIKGKDAAARDPDQPDVLEEQQTSVISGRSIEEIANGDREKPAASAKRTSAKRSRKREAAGKAPPASAKQPFGVKLTHPDRIYWPNAGVTKQGLAEYYSDVWKWMAPHVMARPLALVRCPGGIDDQCFFQKAPWKGIDRNITVVANKGAGGARLLVIHNLDGLVALVQSGVLEIHPWGATVGDLDHPDRLIFDLDPGPEVGWGDLAKAAVEVRERLKGHGLQSFVKTTGGKGLHVVAPLVPAADWDAAKAFCRAIADAMAVDAAQRFVATMAKPARTGHIFVDYLRNARGATAVAPYSTRARPGAPVSTPLAWDELGADLRGDHFRVANAINRIAHLRTDPWAGFFKLDQRLPAAPARRAARKPAKRSR